MATEKKSIKDGIKTSEFWVATLSAAVIAGADALGTQLSTETVASVVAIVVGYAMARMGIKR